MSEHVIQTRINGQEIEAQVEARLTLGDFLRGRGISHASTACAELAPSPSTTTRCAAA